ncbi:MAG TPA: hypothetical protein VFP34_08560 [Microlunatus sp.]|nr:hypothetical protein [Microlunatus sp.]
MGWRARCREVLVSLAALAGMLAAILSGVTPAWAQGPDGPTTRPSPTGLDVSWPQCGRALPEATDFAVVGVTGGTAASTNPCLADQLRWATVATAGSLAGPSRIQLYVNTANPGAILEQYGVVTWPTDNVDGRGADSAATPNDARRNPYGQCTTTPDTYRGYTNDLACSWQYGWNRAIETVDDRFAPAAREAGMSDSAAQYIWWLDVEEMNSWQQGPDGRARNAATLEGMAQFFAAEGVPVVGVYSTPYQWRRIVGWAVGSADASGHAVAGNLIGVPSWIAGSSDAAAAQLRCRILTGFTGGPVAMNQFIADGLDHNVGCRST